MKSTLSISLVCAAAVILGVPQSAQTGASGNEFCIQHNAQGNLLAHANCTLACNKTEPANNTTQAPPNTPCLYSPGENEAVDDSRSAEMHNGTCINGTCTPTKNGSESAVTPITQKANVTSSPGSTMRQSSPQTATTMPANETSSNASSPATGTTMQTTASHNGTTMHANTTTTEKPPNAASPSRLLGAANQGAIITVLALAVFGRSL